MFCVDKRNKGVTNMSMNNINHGVGRSVAGWGRALVGAGGVCAFACVGQAGRPLVIDDADPAPRGGVEIEAGLYRAEGGGSKHWQLPGGIALGFGSWEAAFGFGGWLEGNKEPGEDEYPCGWEDFSLGVKWLVFGGTGGWPRLAVVPSVGFPANLGRWDSPAWDGTLIASWTLGESVGLHANAGCGWSNGIEGEDDAVPLHYGLAIDVALGGGLAWVCEVFAERDTGGGEETAWEMNSGLRWEAARNLVFDIAVGAGLAGDAPDWTATCGFTWLFGGE